MLWESNCSGHWQVWGSKVIQCAGSVEEEGSEEKFISAHPNPFTHETTLTFTLDTRSDVLIEAYNNRGIIVDVIAQRYFDQGTHQLHWNTESLPAGIYIISLNTGNNSFSTKVIKAE